MKVDVDLEQRLLAAAARQLPSVEAVHDLHRLSAGATQETYSFDLLQAGARRSLILRKGSGLRGGSFGTLTQFPMATEAAALDAAARSGVPAPRVAFVLHSEDQLGEGYVMERIEGETIPRKILRDSVYAKARPKLARQCGEALARIHALELEGLPPIPESTAAEQLALARKTLSDDGRAQPVMELALHWLTENQPSPARSVFVHGDFRNGNLVVGTDGLRAVLDWELAHQGDPAEDIGWICANCWRFGEVEQRVGGFGSLDDLLAGYRAAGGEAIDVQRVRYWEVMASLKWGQMCMGMARVYASGLDPSVERAAIGRRVSESEVDILNLIAPRVV